MGGIGCFISSAITLLVSPSVQIGDGILTVFDRSSSLDPSLTNMITKPKMSPCAQRGHPGSHQISITITYTAPKSTKTWLEPTYARAISPVIIQHPSFIPPNPKQGKVDIQPKARSHRDSSPTRRVWRYHPLYFRHTTLVQACQDRLHVDYPTIRCGRDGENPRSYLDGMVRRCLVVREGPRMGSEAG